MFSFWFFLLTGKRPNYGCHGKVGPLLWARVPAPLYSKGGRLFYSLYSQSSHPSFTAPSSFPSICLSTRWLPLFSPQFLSSFHFPCLLFSFPPPSFLHTKVASSRATDRAWTLCWTRRPSTHHRRLTGQRLGAPKDHPLKIPTYVCSKVSTTPALILSCWML